MPDSALFIRLSALTWLRVLRCGGASAAVPLPFPVRPPAWAGASGSTMSW